MNIDEIRLAKHDLEMEISQKIGSQLQELMDNFQKKTGFPIREVYFPCPVVAKMGGETFTVVGYAQTRTMDID